MGPEANCALLTSKERDTETNLDYFGARYFASSQGRFTGVDPEVIPKGLYNPQAWNKYAYTYNNPLQYVDPDGRSPQDTRGDQMQMQEIRRWQKGEITTEQLNDFYKAQGIGGAVGGLAVGAVVAGPEIVSALSLWAARNPQAVESAAQALQEAAAGNPLPAGGGPSLGKIFNASDDVLTSGQILLGKAGNTQVSAAFLKSGETLTASITGAFGASQKGLSTGLGKLTGSIINYAKAQGLSTVAIQAIEPNEKIAAALVKQGYQKVVVAIGDQTYNAYVKVVQVK